MSAVSIQVHTEPEPSRPQLREDGHPVPFRITPELFHQMGQMGIFPPDTRVELLEGAILQMPPIGPEHGCTVDQALQVLYRTTKKKGYYIRVQNALRVGESELLPDIAVVPGKPNDYRERHPTTALLIIEVADTSIDYDRNIKSRVYARAGIPEYWIVNLAMRRLEVYREPEGEEYKWRRYYGLEESASPLFEPEVCVRVRALFEGEE